MWANMAVYPGPFNKSWHDGEWGELFPPRSRFTGNRGGGSESQSRFRTVVLSVLTAHGALPGPPANSYHSCSSPHPPRPPSRSLVPILRRLDEYAFQKNIFLRRLLRLLLRGLAAPSLVRLAPSRTRLGVSGCNLGSLVAL